MFSDDDINAFFDELDGMKGATPDGMITVAAAQAWLKEEAEEALARSFARFGERRVQPVTGLRP